MKEYIDLIRHYHENKQVQYYTREQLLNLQLKKFRQIVKHALTISPFYRDYYAKSGISINDVDDINPRDCPLTDKKMLMENFDQIVSDPDLQYSKLNQFIDQNPDFRKAYLNKYWIVHTSGSTGFGGLYPFSQEEFMLIKIYFLEYLEHMNPFGLLTQIFKRKRVAFFGATHGRFAGVTLVGSSPELLYDRRFFSFLEPIEKIVSELNSFQPDIITGYASSVSQLAEAQLGGFLHIKPERIFCSGDALYTSLRAVIREAFGINPINMYSSTEAPVLAWQANDNSEDLYVGDHMYHIDQVEDKVCISNLYLRTLPIIRYLTEDSVEFQENDTERPFSKIRLKNVRTLDTIEVINNHGQTDVIPSIALVVLHVDGLEQFQYWKMPNNTILVKAKGKGENLTERVKAAVMSMLHERRADKVVHIEIEQVDNIPVDQKTGKFKLINVA